MALDDEARGAVQRAGARVVPEPGPGLQQLYSMNRAYAGLAAVALLLTAAACGETAAPAAGPAKVAAPAGPAVAPPAGAGPTADDTKAATEIFAQRCTPCHGPMGAGDGPASAGLTPPPRNFSDAAWQASVNDEHLEKIIAYGGSAVGKSPAMPPNPDLMSKKGVLQALRQHIRSLKK